MTETERDLLVSLTPPRRRKELTRADRRWLHNQAILITATFPELFPDVVKPAGCEFDHRDEPRPGTLAALQQARA